MHLIHRPLLSLVFSLISVFAGTRSRISSRALISSFLAALLLCFSTGVQAHPAPFSYLDLHLQDQDIAGSLTVHVIDVAHELELDEPATLLDQSVLSRQYSQIGAILQGRFVIGKGALPPVEWTSITPLPGDDAIRLDFTIAAPAPAALEVDAQIFPYDPGHQTFVNIYEDEELRQQWIFHEGVAPQTHFAGTTSGVFAVMGTFIPSGIEHIMIGPDHILFIIGLILLGGTWRRLAIIVTSFTIGHSITLALAALGIVMIPAWVIEPLIALSIVVVGADNLMQLRSSRGGSQGGQEVEGGGGKDIRAGMAFVFGLIHGFGFAYVLREFGLPASSLAWSLFSFNLGVEIGQLAIVLVVAGALYLIRRRSPKAARHIATIGSLAVIAAGAYWFVERVF